MQRGSGEELPEIDRTLVRMPIPCQVEEHAGHEQAGSTAGRADTGTPLDDPEASRSETTERGVVDATLDSRVQGIGIPDFHTAKEWFARFRRRPETGECQPHALFECPVIQFRP
jgi:hypothetical protein